VQFEWDPQTAAANARRRRLTFDEAASILADPLSTTYPGEAHSEEEACFLTIGASQRGRSWFGPHGAKRHDTYHQRPTSDQARTIDQRMTI